MHIVHQQYNSDKLAVMAIFFDIEKGGNADNPLIYAIKPDQSYPTVSSVPLEHLVEKLDKTSFYTY